MNNEGPVRQVLRASVEFDRSLEEGWKWRGRRHDTLTTLTAFVLLGVAAAFISLWTLAVAIPIVGLALWVHLHSRQQYKQAVARTEERFDNYRTVLEENLASEDLRRQANGKEHPLEDRGPIV